MDCTGYVGALKDRVVKGGNSYGGECILFIIGNAYNVPTKKTFARVQYRATMVIS